MHTYCGIFLHTNNTFIAMRHGKSSASFKTLWQDPPNSWQFLLLTIIFLYFFQRKCLVLLAYLVLVDLQNASTYNALKVSSKIPGKFFMLLVVFPALLLICSFTFLEHGRISQSGTFSSYIFFDYLHILLFYLHPMHWYSFFYFLYDLLQISFHFRLSFFLPFSLKYYRYIIIIQ